MAESSMETTTGSRRDLWAQAWESLVSKNDKLAQRYKGVLQEGVVVSSGDSLGQQMQQVVQTRLSFLTSRAYKVQWRDADITVREQVERITNVLVQVLTVVQTVGNTASQVDPVHAGLPWAGVCLLLPLLLNALKGRSKAVAGLEAITILIARYGEVEKIYLDGSDEEPPKLVQAVQDLHTKILEYQLELARYLAKRSFQQAAVAAFQPDVWNDRLENIRVADGVCKNIMTNLDANLMRDGISTLRDKLTCLDRNIREQISNIISSRDLVAWDPGPNPDTSQLPVLYAGFRARASLFRVPLVDVRNDEQLFFAIRAGYASRQHRWWRRSATESLLSLAPLSWYDVKHVDFVKFIPAGPSHATYTTVGKPTIPHSNPPEIRLSAWHHPWNNHSTMCLDEVHNVLNDGQRWGLLVTEAFDPTVFAFTMSFSLGLCFLVGMIADDLGRTAAGTLRASFIAMMLLVAASALIPHPAIMDRAREELNPRRFYTAVLTISVAIVLRVCEGWINPTLVLWLNASLVVAMLYGLFHPPL